MRVTVLYRSASSASAAPSMAPKPNSTPRSSSSWFRRDDTPSTKVSIESVAAIWSGRTLVHKAMSMAVASEGLNSISAGTPTAGVAGASSGSVTFANTGAGTSVAGASASTSRSASEPAAAGTSRWNSSVANTIPASRSTLRISRSVPRYCGRAAVCAIILARVGADPTPTSTNRCTPRPPSALGRSSRSWVSIHRTGEANCQANNSTNKVRANRAGRRSSSSKFFSTFRRMGASTTSNMACTKSRVSSNGRATRFGM